LLLVAKILDETNWQKSIIIKRLKRSERFRRFGNFMKKISENIKNAFESKLSFRILGAVGIVIVILLIFSAGVTVGFHKASFGQAWEENYEKNFGMKPNHPVFDNFPNASGAIGKIIKIKLPTIIVQSREGTEKVILLKTDTQIQKMRESITENDLRLDDFVVVIGTPNTQGQIEAKLIRVMPLGMPVPPPTVTPTN